MADQKVHLLLIIQDIPGTTHIGGEESDGKAVTVTASEVQACD